MSGLRRVTVAVAAADAEAARARLLELFPEGFEERDTDAAVELCVYTDAAGEERVRQTFGPVTVEPVAADWAERWRTFHRPVRIGPLWVGPPWESPPAEAVAVTIDPGRAFGTGAHPTTRLCLELLVELRRGSVVDLGCGSGVLAIAAAKLGFGPVAALDVDAAAVEATRANAAANDVVVEVREADVLTDRVPQADVALANLSLVTVGRLGAHVGAASLIASGYLDRDDPRPAAFRRLERRTADRWAADLYVRE